MCYPDEPGPQPLRIIPACPVQICVMTSKQGNLKVNGSISPSLHRSVYVCAILLLALTTVAAQKKLPAHPIELNTATIEQLQELPEIGPATAKAIIQFRDKSGPFKRVEDLLAIHGISKARLEKLRPYVTVNAPAPK
jgi:competence ComEA-like helix-hairpin-helix protein